MQVSSRLLRAIDGAIERVGASALTLASADREHRALETIALVARGANGAPPHAPSVEALGELAAAKVWSWLDDDRAEVAPALRVVELAPELVARVHERTRDAWWAIALRADRHPLGLSFVAHPRVTDAVRMCLACNEMAAELARRAKETPRRVDASTGFPTFDEAMRLHIERALARAGGRIEGPRGAARLLGIHPNTLRSRMARLGMSPARTR